MLIALAVIAGLLAALLIFAATKPNTFRVERDIRIEAAPAAVYPLLEDFRAWPQWSPWEGLDPNMQRTHSGAPRGVGACYEWLGNKKVGQGRMEITGASAPARIEIKLDFLKPFEAHNITELTLARDGEATQLTWAMHGPNPFMMKLMGVFMNMDKMIGRDFEKGLSSIKAAVEKASA